MILAVDTYYTHSTAKTVAIEFEFWNDEKYSNVYIEEIEIPCDYLPGEFYRRELPCILSILNCVNINLVEMIIIDGYVYLDDLKKLGLGGHLYKSMNEKIPIIGVAKTNFATNKINKTELWRGKSKNPLYISSIGIDMNIAKEHIEKMFGSFRIPKLLKELDQLTKEKSIVN